MHTSPRVETYNFDDMEAHFGGYMKLAELYLEMLYGKCYVSYHKEGMESAYLCMLAKKSSETGENIGTNCNW